MRWTPVASVASEREPGKAYEIKRREDGVLGCSCPGYRFRRGPDKTCKHIRALLGLAAAAPYADIPPLPRPLWIGYYHQRTTRPDWGSSPDPPANVLATNAAVPVRITQDRETFVVRRAISLGPLKEESAL